MASYSCSGPLILLMVLSVVGTRCCCPSQGSLPSRIPLFLHPHSRTAIWFALGWIFPQWCSRPSRQLLFQTPCIRPALPIEGWRSASPPFSHPLGCNPDPSGVCIAHQAWASSDPGAWTSKIDLPLFLDDLAHVPT